MSIKVIKPGIASTLQDAGRAGFRNIGIGSGGAMDLFAMMAANYLCSNDAYTVVMEINFPAPELLFQQNAYISITGGNFEPMINETIVPTWTSLFVKKDSLLKFKQPISGVKMYLAIQGGWKAEKWLNSSSTHLKLQAGGYSGRTLQKEDVIEFAITNSTPIKNEIIPHQFVRNQLEKIYQPANVIRCIKGVEWELLEETSKQVFVQNDFYVSHQSDRMGYRLKGSPILLQHPTNLISSAVDTGTIQLLPEGNMIILMADHQTTGGYPRIASVIKADLPKLAQVKPGQPFNFALVSLKDAETAMIEMQQVLTKIKTACQPT